MTTRFIEEHYREITYLEVHSRRRASLVAQTGKNPPEVWETWVQSQGWEDLLEEGTQVFFLGESPWTEEPGRLVMESQRVRHDWAIKHSTAEGTNLDWGSGKLCMGRWYLSCALKSGWGLAQVKLSYQTTVHVFLPSTVLTLLFSFPEKELSFLCAVTFPVGCYNGCDYDSNCSAHSTAL